MLQKTLTPSGAKARHTNGGCRTLPFLDWHRTALDRGSYAVDVDTIEWRMRNGKPVPVALIEITRADRTRGLNPKYLQSILDRYLRRDLQGYAAKFVASSLKVPCYIVVFSNDLEYFWVYNLTAGGEWVGKSTKDMVLFMDGL